LTWLIFVSIIISFVLVMAGDKLSNKFTVFLAVCLTVCVGMVLLLLIFSKLDYILLHCVCMVAANNVASVDEMMHNVAQFV